MYHSAGAPFGRATSYRSAFASMARMHQALDTYSFDKSPKLCRDGCAHTRTYISPSYEAGKWCTTDMLLLAKTRGLWHTSISRGAAVAGRVELLIWLKEHMTEDEWCGSSVAAAALQAIGNLCVLEWLEQQEQLPKAEEWPRIIDVAARRNNVEALDWLHARGHTFDNYVCNAAAERGALQALQHLTAKGVELDEDIVKAAAEGGNIQMILWLSERGLIDWDDAECLQMMLYHAGTYSHLELGKWLRERGAPWPVSCIDPDEQDGWYCSTKEQFEFLKWAITNDCPWGDEFSSQYCHDVQYEEGWDWIHEQGCPCTCPRRERRSYMWLL
jgi:hypothetical protein